MATAPTRYIPKNTNIPPELKALPQWVCFDKDKRPIIPLTTWPASVKDPVTWGSYEQALASLRPKGICRGVGLVFNGMHYVGIDLDHCRNPKTGSITTWAQEIVDDLDSYTEVSPSGTGLHIIVIGQLSCDGTVHKRAGIKIEMYQRGRHLTFTGNILGDHRYVAMRDLSDFERRYPGAPTHRISDRCYVESGDIVEVSAEVEEMLQTLTDKAVGDPSKDDGHVMIRMLRDGIDPSNAYATFAASPRGEDVKRRKRRHVDDYMQRTMRWAMGQVAKDGFEIEISDGIEIAAVKDSDGLVVQWADETEPEQTTWVWFPYIPAGRITIIAGDPGTGKSQISIDLISRISRGDGMPDGTVAAMSGYCAVVTAEDHTSETVIPRIMACGGDRKRLAVVRKVKIDGQERYLSLPRDLGYLRQFILKYQLKVLVLDPLDAFLGKTLDTYKNHDVRLALSPLEDVAEETNCAVIIIAHLNKKEDVATLYRVGGSIGFIGAARSVLAVSRREQNEEMWVLYSLKSNLCKRPPALTYQIEGVQVHDDIPISHIVWRGHSDFDPEKAGRDDGPQMRKECLDFLKEVFSSDIEVLATDIAKNAKDAGLPMVTVKRYKAEFRVASRRRNGKWYWVEPEGGWK